MPRRILFATSELAPIAKAGGLADVSTALTAELHREGHDVRLFVPYFAQIAAAGIHAEPVEAARDVTLRMGPWTLVFSLYVARWPDGDRPVFLVDAPQFFRRPFLYTNDRDEHLRFALFMRAVLESCQRLQWAPDIVHANDWPTALLPLYLKTVYAWDRLFKGTRSVLSIHNIGYQGVFPAHAVGDCAFDRDRHHLPPDDAKEGKFNFLKTGVLHADAVVTVSDTYAHEIRTPEGGAGLDGLLRQRGDAVSGIVNGVDYTEWSPETDPHIPHRFSAADSEGKRANKQVLLERMGLDEGDDAPLLGVVSRLTHQKGFDLFFDAVPDLFARRPARLVVLGSGETRYVDFFRWLEQAFPGRVAFHDGFDNPLAHLIEAGSDLFLMPSLYEPCGLNQMYSLRYGTIPVVRRTGGLADTVRDYDPAAGTGTGFLFDHFTTEGFAWALERALDAWADRPAWEALRARAMAEDFSWPRQTPKYVALYESLLQGRPARR